MAGPPIEVHHPSPRSLRTLRGVRAELVQLYREAKAGLVEPVLVGRLAHVLNTIQAMDNGVVLEDRLSELEARLDAAKPNGHARGTELHR